jgi:hypothetical protein
MHSSITMTHGFQAHEVASLVEDNSEYLDNAGKGAGDTSGGLMAGFNIANGQSGEGCLNLAGAFVDSTISAPHPPALRQVAMGTAIAASAPGVLPFSIASGFQKRMKTRIKAISLIDRLKAGLEGLPQFLSSRLHGFASLPACTQS